MTADTIRDIDVKRCPDCGARFGVDAAFCPFDGIPLATTTWDPSSDRLVGTIVDQRYEVLATLGEGGMGAVYKVRHVSLDRHFAMKVLRPDLAADVELAERFVQEARTTAAIKHPAVVAITDFGELADGAPYFVMELLIGETLGAYLRRRKTVPPEDAAKIARAIAEGLAASHAAGVVHRDLKPENVFLVGKTLGRKPEDDIRIVDFGAAKIVGKSKLTRPGVVFGTPHYMSPEQASGLPVDGRADLYALGVLLYEMTTGRVPFVADTYMGVLTKHMFAVPPKPSECAPGGVDLGALEDVIVRALEKDPAGRFADASAMATALADAVRPRMSSVRPEVVAGGRAMVFPTLSGAERIQRSVSRHERDERDRLRKIVVVAVVASVVLLGVSSIVASSVRRPGDATSSSTTTRASSPLREAPTSSGAVAPLATNGGTPVGTAGEPGAVTPRATSSPSSVAAVAAVAAVATSGPSPTAGVAAAAAVGLAPSARPRATASGSARVAPNRGPVGSPARPPDDFHDPWSSRAP